MLWFTRVLRSTAFVVALIFVLASSVIGTTLWALQLSAAVTTMSANAAAAATTSSSMHPHASEETSRPQKMGHKTTTPQKLAPTAGKDPAAKRARSKHNTIPNSFQQH